MFTDGVLDGWILRINFGMSIHFDTWASGVLKKVNGRGSATLEFYGSSECNSNGKCWFAQGIYQQKKTVRL